MLNKINWADDRSYRTGTDNEPVQFYSASLCNSTHLELLLGYFSSAAINVFSLGFASFLFAGGRVRKVVNNVLFAEDSNAIMVGNNNEVEPNLIDLSYTSD